MVGLRRASTWLLVALLVMATTIANGAKAPKGGTAPAEAKGGDAAAPTEATGSAAAGPAGAKGSGGSLDVKAGGAKGDGKTDDSAVRTKFFCIYFYSLLL